MILPNLEEVRVDQQKITHYLLAFEHPEGSDKAEFFSRFGFSITEWKILANALIKHAKQNAVVETSESKYGIKYTIHGPLNCPDVQTAELPEFVQCGSWTVVQDRRDWSRLIPCNPLEMIKEHDRVVLTATLAEQGLVAGDIGAVVHVYPDAKAYEVEFVTLEGKTAALVTVTASEIRPVAKSEIPHARERVVHQ